MAVVGAVGIVSVISHVVADRLRAMVDAREAGDYATARAVTPRLLPVHPGDGTGGGPVWCSPRPRCGCAGFDVGDPRLPQIPADATQSAPIAADLAAAGLPVTLPS